MSMHVLTTTRDLPTGVPLTDIDEWLAALNVFARKEVEAWCADVDEVARTGKCACMCSLRRGISPQVC